jgi:hypothetical protein
VTYRYVVRSDSVVVPARVALVLEKTFDFAALRIHARGRDAEVAEVLFALHDVASQYALESAMDLPASDAGSSTPEAAEAAPSSGPMTTTDVATRAGCSDRAVRLAADQGRLAGTRSAGRWQFDPTDVALWLASRKAA